MYDNRENDDINFATLVERVTQQLVSTCSCTPLHLKWWAEKKRACLMCLFFHMPGGSFCPCLQECPLPRRGSWHKVHSHWCCHTFVSQCRLRCWWLILMLLCRRGSPLLMGVRSDHKLSTDHIPVLYRSCKQNVLFLVYNLSTCDCITVSEARFFFFLLSR